MAFGVRSFLPYIGKKTYFCIISSGARQTIGKSRPIVRDVDERPWSCSVRSCIFHYTRCRFPGHNVNFCENELWGGWISSSHPVKILNNSQFRSRRHRPWSSFNLRLDRTVYGHQFSRWCPTFWVIRNNKDAWKWWSSETFILESPQYYAWKYATAFR